MKQTFKKENGILTAVVTFDKDDIEKANKKAVNKLCLNVTVPGFRKGKAPLEKAARYLRNNDVANETADQLLRILDKNFETNEEFQGYIKNRELANGFRPAVNFDKFANDEAQVTVNYVLRPECTKLGEYKGLTSSAVKAEVNDEQVDAEIKRLAMNEAELVPSEKAAEIGDTVNIDFTGLMDGKEFEGGTAKAFDLELGSKKFVPGFEEQCLTHKAGDKFDVALTMPENYPAPLTNKPVVFKVVLNTVKTKEVPEINDEFATTLTGNYVSKDLAELKEKVKKNLTETAEKNFNNARINDLFAKIKLTSEFAIADKYLDRLVADRQSQDENTIEQNGLTLDDYLKLVNMDRKTYEENLRTGVLNEAQASTIYDAVALAEKIAAPAQKDIEAKLGMELSKFTSLYSDQLKKSGYSKDQIDNQINGYINQVVTSMITESVQNKLLELNPYKFEAAKEVKPAAKAEAKKEDKKAKVEKKVEEIEKKVASDTKKAVKKTKAAVKEVKEEVEEKTKKAVKKVEKAAEEVKTTVKKAAAKKTTKKAETK